MLTSLNRLLGMPVVWQDRRLGYVERAVADGRTCYLAGLVVRRGMGAARWADREDVACLGNHCVVLLRKPGRMPEWELPEMHSVFLASGERAGVVTDVLIGGRKMRIKALSVCRNPLDRLSGQRSYAVGFALNDRVEKGGVTAARLLSWTQFKSQLAEEEEE